MRLQNLFKLLFVGAVLSLNSCSPKGPAITVCISDPQAFGLDCVSPNGDMTTVDYMDSENYVCLPPADARTFFEWCLSPSDD